MGVAAVERCAFTGLCPDPGFNALGTRTDVQDAQSEAPEEDGREQAVKPAPCIRPVIRAALGLLPSIALSSTRTTWQLTG